MAVNESQKKAWILKQLHVLHCCETKAEERIKIESIEFIVLLPKKKHKEW